MHSFWMNFKGGGFGEGRPFNNGITLLANLKFILVPGPLRTRGKNKCAGTAVRSEVLATTEPKLSSGSGSGK